MLPPIGNVAGLESNVEFVDVWSLTGEDVIRAMSSLVNPTPWVEPRGLPKP